MIVFDQIAQRVLSKKQQKLKLLLEEFSKTHFLAGGTAIALHLGHRQSIDFDFFTLGNQGTGKDLAERIQSAGFVLEKGSNLNYLSDEEEPEATIYVNGVKVELINFDRNPFNVKVNLSADQTVCGGIKTPSILELASMKTYAMMYRNKWKDAVDLIYILKKNPKLTFKKVIQKTEKVFTDLYQKEATLETILENKWDTSEAVHYVTDKIFPDEEIKQYLIAETKRYIEDF